MTVFGDKIITYYIAEVHYLCSLRSGDSEQVIPPERYDGRWQEREEFQRVVPEYHVPQDEHLLGFQRPNESSHQPFLDQPQSNHTIKNEVEYKA